MKKAVMIASVALLALMGAGFGIYTIDKKIEIKDLRIQQLEKQTEDLQQELTKSIQKSNSLEGEKAEAVSTGASLYLKTEIFKKGILDLATNIGKLDQLLLKDDMRNIEAVEWYTDHGEFTLADGELAEAKLRYREWKDKQGVSDRDYKQIKDSMKENLDAFSELMDTFSELDFSDAKSTNQIN